MIKTHCVSSRLIPDMPSPGMESPQWETLVPLSRRGFSVTLAAVMELEYRLVLITSGDSSLCQHLRDIHVHGEFDVRGFFPRHARRGINCRHKTAFSHNDVWDSFLGPELLEARAAVWTSIEATIGAPLRAGSGTIVCIILCTHGLHRSQAVARSIGDLAARRGCSVCVLNSSVFSRRWCNEDYRALVKHPLQAAPAAANLPAPVDPLHTMNLHHRQR